MPQYTVKINTYRTESADLATAQELAKVLAAQNSPEPAFVLRNGEEFCRYECPICEACHGTGHNPLIAKFSDAI